MSLRSDLKRDERRLEEKIQLRRERTPNRIRNVFNAVQCVAFREAQRLPGPEINLQRQFKGRTEEKRMRHSVVAGKSAEIELKRRVFLRIRK